MNYIVVVLGDDPNDMQVFKVIADSPADAEGKAADHYKQAGFADSDMDALWFEAFHEPTIKLLS